MLWRTISKTRYDKYATGVGWFPSFRIQQNPMMGGYQAAIIFSWKIKLILHRAQVVRTTIFLSPDKKNTQPYFDPFSFLKDQKEVRKCYRQYHVTFRRVGHLMCKLELEKLRKKWNKFDMSKIVFALRKTSIWIQNSDISDILCCIKNSDITDLIFWDWKIIYIMTWGWVAKLNYFITQITSKYDLTMFCGHGNELGNTLPGKGNGIRAWGCGVCGVKNLSKWIVAVPFWT